MHRPDDLLPLKEAAVVVGRSMSTVRLWVRNEELAGWREVEGDPNSRLLISRQEILLLAARAKPMHPGGPRPEDDAEEGMPPVENCDPVDPPAQPNALPAQPPKVTEQPATQPVTPPVDPNPPAPQAAPPAPQPPQPAQATPQPATQPAPQAAPPAPPPPLAPHRPDPRDEQLVALRMMVAGMTAERDGLKMLIEAQKATISALEARCRDLEHRADSERLRATEHHDRLVSADAELRALQQHQRLPWYQRLLGAPAAAPSLPPPKEP